MKSTPLDRRALERLWRDRLNEARLRLEAATSDLNQTHRDFYASGGLSSGHFALERAIRVERMALVEYRRILCIFIGLVSSGRVPDELPRAAATGG